MDLITPDIGLLFWTTIVFLIVLIILKKFAWKPILNAINIRENTISSALSSAEKTKAEMAKLQAKNEKILARAKAERDAIIKEAREIKESIITEAREIANTEATKMFEATRISIENEKISAMDQIKEQVAILSLEIAEKILLENLSSDKKQKELLNKLIENIKVN